MGKKSVWSKIYLGQKKFCQKNAGPQKLRPQKWGSQKSGQNWAIIIGDIAAKNWVPKVWTNVSMTVGIC